ncbi:hypothetical protein A8E97_02035 [Burkholderia cenocepacia]|nr:hypothetical protein A8E88_24610 [Burkholderia cenocepacia]ONV89793.1 hypothetical protein A8E89_16975 [Burkholderia cenocepacia]ONW17202.1 hypothetical protein A8E90_16860 [Burkholderia cenocepacia]ONW17321.1 hypothetical protein A8E94_09625 [Burkholderia cenocepacia]ONW42737.1 hypothetical protein A8E99_16880 [Burkholderia cenocepacia]
MGARITSSYAHRSSGNCFISSATRGAPVVILRPDDWEERLTTSNVEAVRAMLRLYPVEAMVTEPQ